MPENSIASGYVCLNLGLLCSATSSFLDRTSGRGSVANIVRGALHGLSIVAFGAAIASLVPNMWRSVRRMGRKQAPGYAIWR